ncbi:glycosyltransferase [Patescibacteria group bacterium]
MKISVHTLVKNEERFVWYAINSVISFVDEILVWDNGSTDNTIKIIQSIKSPKIKFNNFAGVPSLARQRMLEETKADWILILDGDEIWWESSIKQLVSGIRNNYDCVVTPNYMLVGDIFHYQEGKAGKYKIANRTGHLNIRFVRNAPGLHVKGVYPNEAYVTKEGVKIQNFPKEKIYFSDTPYLHTSFLKKKKYELGIPFPLDFYYPEVLFIPRPKIIPSPWVCTNYGYKFQAVWQTPLKKIKRRIR